MAHQITGIDHVAIAVADLAEAKRRFTRLGFVASPPGSHPEWGTANQCLMFGGDYVELLAAVGDGVGADRVRAHLAARGEGLMGVALGSRDAAQSCESLNRAGVAAGRPSALSRLLAAPEGELAPRFTVVDLPAAATPGLPAFLCQHLTPELLRRPEWLAHPNGATGIISLTVVVERPEALMADYDRVFGPAASTPTDEMVTVHSGRGLLFLVTPDGFDHLHPDMELELPPPPALVALSIAVDDLGRAQALLTANGVRCVRKGAHLEVDPAEALGIGLEFVER